MGKFDVSAVVVPSDIIIRTIPVTDPTQFHGFAALVVSVSDSTGAPVTGILQQFFDIRISSNPPLFPLTQIGDFVDLSDTASLGESFLQAAPGFYFITAREFGGVNWFRLPYLLTITIKRDFVVGGEAGFDNGQTTVLLDLANYAPTLGVLTIQDF